MSNRLRVQAALSEFLHAWTCGGKASLHLDTSEGGCTVSFTAHLGHPGALLLPTPPPAQASPIPRHRGRADRERNRQRAAAHQAAQQATATPISSSPPVTSTAATASAATPSSSAPVLHPASATVAPLITPASASVASIPATAASPIATVSLVSAIPTTPVMTILPATAPVATTPTSPSVIRRQPCCTSCGLPVKGHKGPLGSRCPALESLRGAEAEGDTSLNTSPGKDGERDVNCWNCEVPLTPTHQCDEVVNCDEFNYTHHGKYRDERGVSYNSSSDASDIAQRCPECPECSVERHAALFREK